MTDRCTQYALDVVAGVIIAGEYVRLACQRHLDDLEKAKAAPYKYYFDVEKSEEIINFAEELTIAEGDEQENVTAYPFQCFILGSLNGWRTKEKGHRRFRTSYVQLGRQNGKSFINGILACYYGNFDGYKYGKIFCTATKQDQANIVFDEIVKFINSDEDLSEWFKVHEHNHTIDCLCTHSEIKALSGDTKSLDGHRAYLGIVDEYHAHKTNQMYKLLEGGIKKLKSALISVITTAGFDLKSPCYKLYEYCCNLLKGVFENDGFYYKYNEKVLFRTDSKTQMEYLKNGVSGSIMKPNEARRKLDLPDGEGGDTLLANGSIVPLTMAGAAYQKGQIEQEETEKPEQPEEETEPDTEQPDTTGQPDETDEAEDEEEQEGGE